MHFAGLALEAAAQASADGSVASRPRTAMLEEAALMHAWGGCLAMLNAVAVHLNLPASDEEPDLRRLLTLARGNGVHAEALTEMQVLRQDPASWLNQLEAKARTTWQVRVRRQQAPQDTGLIASSAVPQAREDAAPAVLVAAAHDFLERHKATMEEW